jgi:hypothetical protein
MRVCGLFNFRKKDFEQKFLARGKDLERDFAENFLNYINDLYRFQLIRFRCHRHALKSIFLNPGFIAPTTASAPLQPLEVPSWQ